MSRSSKPIEPPPPDGLGDAGRVFWRQIVADYELEPADLARLAVAADAVDIIAFARQQMAEGNRDRAIMSQWRDASKLLLSCLRALGIDSAVEVQK